MRLFALRRASRHFYFGNLWGSNIALLLIFNFIDSIINSSLYICSKLVEGFTVGVEKAQKKPETNPDLLANLDLLTKVDWNIAPLVKALWQLGITTLSSCEGHLRKNSSTYPFVMIGPCDQLSSESFRRLIFALGLWNGGEEPVISKIEWILLPCHTIRSNEPEDDFYSLTLQPVEKNNQRSLKLLRNLQCSAKELGAFFSGIALSHVVTRNK